MTIGAGLIERDDEARLYNSTVVVMPDGRYACHRKLHAFVSEHLTSGDRYTVFDTPHGWRVAVLICYDNNIIENVRACALAGAELLLAPHQTGGCRSGSPFAMGPIDVELWERRDEDPQAIEAEFQGDKGRGWLMRWLPARAHDNGMFLVFSNGVGRDDDEVRTGNAMILDPYGRILSETCRAADAMVLADLDSSLRDRCTGVRWIRARRPDLYGALSRPHGSGARYQNGPFRVRHESVIAWLLGRRWLPEDPQQKAAGQLGDPPSRAFPGPRHVEHSNAMCRNPLSDLVRRGILLQVDDQARTGITLGQAESQLGATGERTPAENQRRVGVEHVAAGATEVLRGSRFAQLISQGDRPVLGQPPARAPAAMRDAGRQGRVQRAAVDTRLSTRHDALWPDAAASLPHRLNSPRPAAQRATGHWPSVDSARFPRPWGGSVSASTRSAGDRRGTRSSPADPPANGN